MKHIYFCTTHPSFSETFVTTEMQSLIDRGEEVLVYSLRKPPSALTPCTKYLKPPCSRLQLAMWSLPGLRVLIANLNAGLRFRPHNALRLLGAASHAARVAKMVRRLTRQGAVVLHAHFLDRPADVVAMLPTPGATKLVTVHAGDAYKRSDVALRDWRVASFDTIICASDYVRRGLSERASGIQVVHCGVAIPIGHERHIDRAFTHVRVSTVARLIRSKNHPYAAAVVEELAARGISVEWHIVGDGPMEPWIRQFAETTTCNELRVVMHGAVAHDRSLALMRATDLMILPSQTEPTGSDGIPVALMEAMASGVLAVSTPVGGIPELVIDGVTGLMGDPLDPHGCAAAIAGVLSNPGRMQEIVDNAFAHVHDSFNAYGSASELVKLTQSRSQLQGAPR